jgi:hypothetical protein
METLQNTKILHLTIVKVIKNKDVRNSQPRGEVQEEVTKKCNMGFYNKTVII